jgi:hypothetical protein
MLTACCCCNSYSWERVLTQGAPPAQRVVLLSYDKAARRIAFRHFSILVAPSGVSKAVKALVGRRALPDMGELKDVSEFLTRSGYGSVRLHIVPRKRHSRIFCPCDRVIESTETLHQSWEGADLSGACQRTNARRGGVGGDCPA